jgi:hypothetical protein
VKDALKSIGVESFMAHEDIQVSQEWRDRIIEELRSADVFVPLLSASFRKSEWAPQEIGFAISRADLLIIPVQIDTTPPFGFISTIQGRLLPFPVEGSYFHDAILRRFPRQMIARLIDALAGASSFRRAEALFRPLLPVLGSLTPDEAERIAKASTENGEIWDAGLCRSEYLPKSLAANRHQIDPQVLRPLEYQIEHARWYDAEDDA